MSNDAINQNSAFDLFDCKIDVSKQDLVTEHLVLSCLSLHRVQMRKKDLFFSQGTQHGTESAFSFYNNLYNPSPHVTDATMASSDA